MRRLTCALLVSVLLAACSGDTPPATEVRVTDTGLPDQGPGDDSGPTEDAGPLDAGVDQGIQDLGQPDLGPTDTGPLDVGFDVQLPTIPARVETSLPVEEVQAGTRVRVTCRVLTEDGDELPDEPTRFTVHPDVGWSTFEDDPGVFVPEVVGEYLVTCQAPAAGLLDETPAALTVVPGPVHTVVTRVEPMEIVAGDQARAWCEGYDRFGNPLPIPDVTLQRSPRGDGFDSAPDPEQDQGFVLQVTRAGFYDVICSAPGSEELWPASLSVSPGLPASLILGISPSRRSYRIGEVVTLTTLVTDRYDNQIPDARVSLDATPPVPEFGPGRFRFDQDGTFTFTARVQGETEGGQALEASETVVVNSQGPAIDCVSPGPAGVVERRPGSPMTFVGRVSDPNGVASVSVGEQEVEVGGDGRFQVSVNPVFGLNFVEIVATDSMGLQSSTFCDFLVAGDYAPPGSYLDDAIMFRMGQAAMDDGPPPRPIHSLGDLLRLMLSSDGLVDTVDAALLASNPLYDACAVDCGILGCCVHATITYRAGTFSLPGPNDLSMDLVDGGLSVDVTLHDPELGFHVENTGPNVGDATIGTEYIRVAMVFDAGLDATGRPAVRLRPGSEVVEVGDLQYDGSWWNDWLVDIALGLFGGYFRGMIADQIRSYLRDNIDSLLDGVLGNLDVSALGTQFSAPGIAGRPPVTMGVGIRFSRASFTPARALFGLGIRLQAPAVRNDGPPGAPMPPGSLGLDPGGARSLGASVSYGVLNQALYVLWRAGYLDFDLGSMVPGAEGATMGLDIALPPVLMASDGAGHLVFGLGGVRMTLQYPNLFDEPLEIDLAALASAGVSLVGENEIHFDGLTVDRLLFTTPTVHLAPGVRAILEDLLTEIVQSLLDDMVNSALPALPIPEFTLPASLEPYGVPGGTRLGIRQPVLQLGPAHFLVLGNMGE